MPSSLGKKGTESSDHRSLREREQWKRAAEKKREVRGEIQSRLRVARKFLRVTHKRGARGRKKYVYEEEFDDVGDEGVVAEIRSRSARYPRLLGDEYHSRSLCDTGSAK